MNRIVKLRKVPTDISLGHEFHPVMQRVLLSRGITSVEEVKHSLDGLLPFHALSNIGEACELLSTALKQQQSIMIIADYDSDGATSCALAMRGLRAMGASKVNYLVPNRFDFGYGLSPEIVDEAAKQSPDIIITVDNGIANIDGVKRANELGIKVLITDHHLPGDTLPDAEVIVNPNLKYDEFASKELAGVGVMFYLLAGLRSELRKQNWFKENNIQEPNLAEFLDLVALGTVADLVKLDRNNRILVNIGLQRIRNGKACMGINALLQVTNIHPMQIKTSDLGFYLGPRLNAAGRLSDMALGIECLLTDDKQKALEIAAQLDKLNRERRHIQDEMQDIANEFLDVISQTQDEIPNAICIKNEKFHQGVVGILASKLKEQFYRPVIVFAPDDKGVLKGSGRSVAGIHLRDVLALVETSCPGLMIKFGGHAMAAGLSINESNYTKFEQAYLAAVEKFLQHDTLENVVYSDGELSSNEMTMSFAKTLTIDSIWGQGFPEPVFEGKFELLQRRIVGDKHLKMVLCPENADSEIHAIAFNKTDEDWPEYVEFVYAVYKLAINHFRGQQSVQLLIDEMTPVLG